MSMKNTFSFFKKISILIPFVVFIMLAFFLWRGLSLNPNKIPSPLINQPAPAFQLPLLLHANKFGTQKDFIGQVTILNVWATWCYACLIEHSTLLELAKNHHVNFYGLNYKDDESAARAWLLRYGNPYQTIVTDKEGKVAIDFGVYGTPETFIIDKKGKIRYKHVGPITVELWSQTLNPLLSQLQSE